MSRPAVLTLRQPTDVIAAVPYLLGYPPEDSLVALAAVPGGAGPARRVGFLARLDLPRPDQVPAAARRLLAALRAERVRSAVLVAFGSVPELLWPTLLPLLRAAGIAVPDAITVRDGRWWSAVCADPACCPPEGRPVLSPTESGGPSRVAAECVGAGLAIAPQRPWSRATRGPRPPAGGPAPRPERPDDVPP